MTSNRRRNRFTVAFYNVENLFDTVDNPNTYDNDFTPNGKLKWGKKKYHHKLRKITSVISQLGNNQSAYPPVIIGLVEVENAMVVNDLVKHKNLSKFNYDYVHYDSPDERGIDVALMYNKDFFEVISSETHPLLLTDNRGEVDYTRDLLVVKGMFNDELVHVLVNHWPSRREGETESEKNRIKAAQLTRSVMDKIKEEESAPKFIVMGDFNDDPTNKSIKEYLISDDLYNPMKPLYERGIGTTTHYKKWHLFDQIMFSKAFFNVNESKHSFLNAKIYNKDWLKIYKGKYKGSPFRTFIGPFYKGGFSDHFPIYVTFEKET
ncbi:endonuclease/exonuclease/phosphatase family protein [Tenacibaculum sp. 1B UA]|uniref:endonuclease/exonuclease/phosphatase family protein n=1 Tax=unclassified Tenacibaculum TaxID=2635139 RepID=UPI0026E131D9|nr:MULTISPECIES: endonuclease/exonuclease/phosphatase family protein [unclassified Tenacibaculum]MDO6674396.1 endonuclease/exonuclease/phosphatase family protein [Tenacibaculum sp. 1_MG-2023]MDX8552148.1 endonuclease/exonuclease/phosphatase family protein [Tenacibaculum sp. 1B UA]